MLSLLAPASVTLPTTGEPSLTALFFEVKTLLSGTYRYPQGNCHNVVHFASRVLHRYGVAHRKLWLFAPCRYEAGSGEAIRHRDPNGLAFHQNLAWGYHVALLVGEEIFDYFIDENQPLTFECWLRTLAPTRYRLSVESAESYLFYAENSPGKGLFSGKFFPYEGRSRAEGWVEKGLAINQTACEFFENEICTRADDALRFDYRLLAGSVLNFECVFRDETTNRKMTPEFLAYHDEVIQRYRSRYAEHLESWRGKMQVWE